MSDDHPRFDPDRDPEWRSRLSPLQYHVTREAGTERPNTGLLYMEERDGSYYCICCGHILFTSEIKYHSGCGWPAFTNLFQTQSMKLPIIALVGFVRKLPAANVMATWVMCLLMALSPLDCVIV